VNVSHSLFTLATHHYDIQSVEDSQEEFKYETQIVQDNTKMQNKICANLKENHSSKLVNVKLIKVYLILVPMVDGLI
jgi:hypothetical protein